MHTHRETPNEEGSKCNARAPTGTPPPIRVPTTRVYPQIRVVAENTVAHRKFSAGSAPSCEGTLPLRLLSLRRLRERWPSGLIQVKSLMERTLNGEGNKCNARANDNAAPFCLTLPPSVPPIC